MNLSKDIAADQQLWPWWRWIMAGLALLALVLSLILSWHYLVGGSMAGCGTGSPCDQVLNSRWSTIAGILPVSGLAVGVYIALLVTILYIGTATELAIRRLAWSVMLILAGSVTGSAIWFIILQKWIIGGFCTWCMSAHITGILMAALIFWRAKKEFDNFSGNTTMTNQSGGSNLTRSIKEYRISSLQVAGRVMIGLLLAAIMSGSQISFVPSAVYSGGESQDNITLIDYNTAPMVGSPDAPYLVTLLFDYQCSHCQKLHFMLDEAIRAYDNKLTFILCPAPLSSQCNPYIPRRDEDAFNNSCDLVRTSLAVWLADSDAFPAFENWMFTYESGNSWQPRSLEAARIKAVELVGQTKFDAALADNWIGEYLQTSSQIYGNTIQTGIGGIPKLIYGSQWVIPQPYNTDDLIKILQESLAVPDPDQ